MNVIDRYLDVVTDVLKRIAEEERSRIEKAAEIVADATENGKVVHVIGAGHSAMLGEELFYRAGGLANVNPIIDTDITVGHGAKKSTLLEHVVGYARALLESARVEQGDVVIVVSTSGVNTFPVEAAIVAKELGARTIGITSVSYSKTLQPKNPYGKRLFEVVDVYIDNKVPKGDAALELGEGIKVAPLSTIANCFIANAIVAKAVEKMLAKGIKPAVWISSHLPEAKKHNEELFKKFGSKIKLL